MSDTEAIDDVFKPFDVERAKTGRAKCKKCKSNIDKDTVRIAKIMSNPFGDGIMKAWHHVSCLFEVFCKQRATSKKINNPIEDISGWENLCQEDKDLILEKLKEFDAAEPFKVTKTGKTSNSSTFKTNPTKNEDKNHPPKDSSFFEFQKICSSLSKHSSYLEKTAIIANLFKKGLEGDAFKGDVILWCRLLLPGTVKRVYNLQSKALIKLFSRILRQDEQDMLEDLEKGDVAETIRTFYNSNLIFKPAKQSTLALQEVDKFLETLAKLTKEDEQMFHFKSIIGRCTSEDLRTLIRLIKHDLRTNAGPKHILGGVHSEAYEAFQVSRDLPAVIRRCLGTVKNEETLKSPVKRKNVTLSMMTPVLPMLAEACKSVDMAMEKCPNGMLSEIKYDGERVQVHKRGEEFAFFSRSLKPVLQHKVSFIREYIPKAIPKGDDLILDAEILMIDTLTGRPLPFGALGIHKKDEFKDANVCLFIFDIIYYNGEVLLDHIMWQRRKILEEHVKPIKNRIMLSEIKVINRDDQLRRMIAKVFKLGLEGLVLKDVDGKYEPGKRHWLKVKKDYLFKGAMADSADLVVLGAWYGTGQKGGMMSVFLTGSYDPNRKKWVTVTKVHTGLDDATLAKLQTTLKMTKISKDPNLVPNWLIVNKPMIPDFVAENPKEQPVWEITGAEFTNQGCHTADGISIRFPRVTRIREDKNWETATNLEELRNLFNRSSESVDYESFLGTKALEESSDEEVEDDGKLLRAYRSPKKHEMSEPDTPKSLLKINIKNDDNDSEISKKESKNSPISVSPKKLQSRSPTKIKVKEEMDFNVIQGETSREKSKKRKVHKTEPTASSSKKMKPKVIQKTDELKNIFSHVSVCFTTDFEKKKKRHIRKSLENLGAKIVSSEESNLKVDYVVHETRKISIMKLRRMEGLSTKARHVCENWAIDSIDKEELQNPNNYAITLSGTYCECPCPH